MNIFFWIAFFITNAVSAVGTCLDTAWQTHLVANSGTEPLSAHCLCSIANITALPQMQLSQYYFDIRTATLGGDIVKMSFPSAPAYNTDCNIKYKIFETGIGAAYALPDNDIQNRIAALGC
jgi:hypothetical protein